MDEQAVDIYPHHAQRGSLSNGVQSMPVAVNSNAPQCEWRGCHAQQSASRVAFARYGLLYASYRDSCWYWSCMVLLERQLLFLVFVFVPAPASYHWLTAVNVSILTTHLLVRPHRLQRDNVLEAALLLLLCLQTSITPLYAKQSLSNALAAVVSAVVVAPH